jgi:hypothetical protein
LISVVSNSNKNGFDINFVYVLVAFGMLCLSVELNELRDGLGEGLSWKFLLSRKLMSIDADAELLNRGRFDNIIIPFLFVAVTEQLLRWGFVKKDFISS